MRACVDISLVLAVPSTSTSICKHLRMSNCCKLYFSTLRIDTSNFETVINLPNSIWRRQNLITVKSIFYLFVVAFLLFDSSASLVMFSFIRIVRTLFFTISDAQSPNRTYFKLLDSETFACSQCAIYREGTPVFFRSRVLKYFLKYSFHLF